MSITNGTQQIVNKAWNFAHVLRDDGLSYIAYTEQITFLLFLKMADEQTKAPYNKPNLIPPDAKGRRFDWQELLKRDGEDLETQYRLTLDHLGKQPAESSGVFSRRKDSPVY